MLPRNKDSLYSLNMLSEQAKERLGLVFDVAKTIFHIGFMPAVLYLGNYNNKTKNC